jgi:murein L,D-transpeptidase YcbB/YkuD
MTSRTEGLLFARPALKLLQTAAAVCVLMLGSGQAEAQQFSRFAQALAEGASVSEDISAFYRASQYSSIWTGPNDSARRTAFLTALSRAGDHGLPASRYDIDGLMAAFGNVTSERDRGMLEARVTETFVQFANDLHSGVLEPGQILESIVRVLPRLDVDTLLADFQAAEPVSFLRNLAPTAPEYGRLFRAKHELEATIAAGGWGPQVQAYDMRPGQTGQSVIVLRNRLVAMGLMERTASSSYDGQMQAAVQRFQQSLGIDADGVAGSSTINAINISPEERLRLIIVAMERERWMNIPRGDRHVWVNLVDFHARIIDFDQVTFVTRSVIGQQTLNTQTPEFSDMMEFMEINPDWTLPRSIVADYLPAMQADPFAVAYLNVVDGQGNVIPRDMVNFNAYNINTFPFNLRQPPGPGNALGTVKFMFPNQYAIYLHDTPARSLFNTTVRTYSHGCVRLNDPEEFAYELLRPQESDPISFYQRIQRSGLETQVNLVTPIPVHIVYRTAYTSVRGEMNYRNDVYGRDAAIFQALQQAGVVIGGVQS